MAFLDQVVTQAKKNIQTIVLPEGADARTIEAAKKIRALELAKLIIIGNEKDMDPSIKAISGVQVIEPTTFEKLDAYAESLATIRRSKGMTIAQAKQLLLDDVLYLGVMMVKMGDADGMVAGAAHSTANVLRPALQILKTAPGTKLVSAVFLMEVPGSTYGEEGLFVFGDCALNPNPTAEELAHIAVSSAATFESIVHVEPIVSLLSFSTKGSATHPDVEKVIEATEIAKKLAPHLTLDGELQLDASIVPSVGTKKAPKSSVAGKANVIVFPNLDAGNIGYKLVQRLANANAYGPLCQGLAMPVNDLSRGCSAEDIVGTVALTALQAQMKK